MSEPFSFGTGHLILIFYSNKRTITIYPMVCAILKWYWCLFAFWKITPVIVGSSAFAIEGRESDAVLFSNIHWSKVHGIMFYSGIGNKDCLIDPVEKIAYSALRVLRPVLALMFFQVLVILEKFYYLALLWCFVKEKILNFWKISVIKKLYLVMTLVFLGRVGHFTEMNILHTISGSELMRNELLMLQFSKSVFSLQCCMKFYRLSVFWVKLSDLLQEK